MEYRLYPIAVDDIPESTDSKITIDAQFDMLLPMPDDGVVVGFKHRTLRKLLKDKHPGRAVKRRAKFSALARAGYNPSYRWKSGTYTGKSYVRKLVRVKREAYPKQRSSKPSKRHPDILAFTWVEKYPKDAFKAQTALFQRWFSYMGGVDYQQANAPASQEPDKREFDYIHPAPATLQ